MIFSENMYIGNVRASEYVKNQPPYILKLINNTDNIDGTWKDQSFRDKEKQGVFNDCIFGMMPSLVLAPKIQYLFNDKIYEENEIKLLHMCPGTGASLMVFEKPN